MSTEQYGQYPAPKQQAEEPAYGYAPAPDPVAEQQVPPGVAKAMAVIDDQQLARPRIEVHEKAAPSVPGGLAFLLLVLVLLGSVGLFAAGMLVSMGWLSAIGVLLFVLSILGASSLTIVQPGETKVLQFLGRYVGTIRRPGMQLTLPWTEKRRVSVKVRNFETRELKVNDAEGNPVNIAAIIVWQVSDTAKAVFAVENSEQFVYTQSEAALRHVASSHPYDNAQAGEETLRGSTDIVARELANEVAARVSIAGIEIVEARISSLAYAQEIAQAMLQRQQAAAVVAARTLIVEGAVGMVEQALRRLESDSVVTMSEERKAAMVSNLLVVLCGESRAQPIVNAGNL